MINIAIIEDDASDKELLLKTAERIFHENHLEVSFCCFSSAEEYLSSKEKVFGLYFLDISLSGMTGMDLAKKIRESGNRNSVIIFVTSLASYAIEGYLVDASAYILKPITYEDMNLKLRRIIRDLITSNDETICLQTTDGLVTVNIMDIRYIETQGHYLCYHLGEKTLKSRDTIKNAETYFQKYDFLLINQCYIVNLRHVNKFDEDMAYVDDEPLKISRSKKKILKEALLKFYAG